MKKLISLTLLIVSVAFSNIFAQPIDAMIDRGKEILYGANIQFNQAEMFKARGLFERALTTDEENYFAKYYLAYTDYSLTLYFMQKKDKDQFKKYSESSGEILKEIISTNESDAEAISLLGSLYGIQVSMNPDLGATLGTQNIALTSKALEIAPDNPRVLLQKGISKFNSPEFVGGSKKDALKYFTQSIEIFESQPENLLDINWGYIDALAWLGITYLNLGNTEAAIETFNKSLNIEPNYAWVKYQLLPKAKELIKSSKPTEN